MLLPASPLAEALPLDAGSARIIGTDGDLVGDGTGFAFLPVVHLELDGTRLPLGMNPVVTAPPSEIAGLLDP
jgi:hypothetical protein